MAEPREHIRLRWRLHPDEHLADRELLVPELSVRLRSEAVFGRTKAILAPFAGCSVLPLFIAREMGLPLTELGERISDPLLPHLTLWLWRASHPLEVYGDDIGAPLVVELPIAFDSSEKLDAAVLGQHFFHRVRIVLELRGDSSVSLP